MYHKFDYKLHKSTFMSIIRGWLEKEKGQMRSQSKCGTMNKWVGNSILLFI